MVSFGVNRIEYLGSVTKELVQVEVFWVVTLCGVTVGYQCFGGPCGLHLQVLRNAERHSTYHH